MLRVAIDLLALLGAILGLISILVRAVESIYQLSRTPDLNTWGKCVQVIKNFFTIEKYN
jgi:uncharacterized membrane protein YjfL (UPF0719 family)